MGLLNQVTLLVNRASAFIAGYIGRNIVSRAYDVYVDGGKDKIFLPEHPVTALTTLKYRQGTIASPTWVAFNANDYMLYGEEGYIQFLFGTVHGLSAPIANGAGYRGTKNIHVAFTAGYLIDWESSEWGDTPDPTLHTLPMELTTVCMNMVLGMFNTDKSQGTASESVEGASITYDISKSLSAEDRGILDGYKRINI